MPLIKESNFLIKTLFQIRILIHYWKTWCHAIVEFTEEIAPKRKSKKKKPKLQIMSEEIFKAIEKEKNQLIANGN